MSINILLIDDNPDQIAITRRVLQKSGDYRLDAACEADEGLQKLKAGRYDLVLCDYRLPGKSGLDVLKRLKEEHNEVPFIMVTSAGSERVAVEAIQEGATDYLVKDSAYEDFLPNIIARSFERYNDKKELKQAQQRLIQAARLESVGRLAAGAAHEVRNPLAIILMGIEFLCRSLEPPSESTTMTLEGMREAVLRADRVIRGLLDFSSQHLMEPKTAALNPLIEQALLLVNHEFKERACCRSHPVGG